MQARMNGGTNIALSIKQAGQLLKDQDPEAARIIVLLTDGRVDAFQGEPLAQASFFCMGSLQALRQLKGGDNPIARDEKANVEPLEACPANQKQRCLGL